MKRDFKIKPKQILVEHYINSEEAKSMLTIYEAMVIERLASYIGSGCSNNNQCWKDQTELARSCFMSLRQLGDTLKKLKQKEIINIKRTKYRNYYSFNEFWLSEIEHFSAHCFAANNFLSLKEIKLSTEEKSRSAPHASRSAPHADLSIYNNIKNNKQSYPQAPKPKEYLGLAPTAEKGSPLFEETVNQKKYPLLN